MSSFAEPVTSAQVLHICYAALANKEFLYHQKKTEADTLFMDNQNLRSENNQLRAIAIQSDKEKNEEMRKTRLLQQVIDAQRRVINDYEQMRPRKPFNPPSLVHSNVQTPHGDFPAPDFAQQGYEGIQEGQTEATQGLVTPGGRDEMEHCEGCEH